ncbi:MAG: glycosyltransferase, partial [Proteobacteria bacterium]|nr:glycosyltransferase [Pseudomonadota bacterium]
MTRRVLMIAYHFPPLAGSSGIQRTLRFVQHLPAFGWEPAVLTTTVGAYERTSADLNTEVPAGLVVERAFAFDAARQLSLAGRYPGFLARPDRWMTWRWDAVRRGMRMIRRLRPDAVWSTYPIATAHVIGHALARRSGLPWIADFRDPMAQEGYPADPATWRSFREIEEATIGAAQVSVFTTPGAARMYRERYPSRAAAIHVIENGYDEESFAGLDAETLAHDPLNPGAVTLLHSGIVYPSERDPTQLFEAVAALVGSGRLSRDAVRFRFRAAGHDAMLAELAQRHAITDVVELCPPIP